MFNSKAFKRIVTTAAVLALVFVTLAGQVAASTGQKKITAVYKETTISYNNRPVMLRDSKGVELKVFSYNSYDYVPVQAIAGRLRLTASYSSKTNVITLKTGTAPANGKNGYQGKAGSKPGNTTPGAFGMRFRNSTSGAFGMRPGTKPSNGKSTTQPVKITSVKKTLTVTYKNIKVTYNGKAIALKDSKGKALEPFIYGSDEYVPLKALSSALGISFSYDTKTNRISLTKK